jgi:hypothetical protein
LPRLALDYPREQGLSATTCGIGGVLPAASGTRMRDIWRTRPLSTAQTPREYPTVRVRRSTGINAKMALLRGRDARAAAARAGGTPRIVPLAPGAAANLMDAKLTDAGLLYACNVPKTATKGRIVLRDHAWNISVCRLGGGGA